MKAADSAAFLAHLPPRTVARRHLQPGQTQRTGQAGDPYQQNAVDGLRRPVRAVRGGCREQVDGLDAGRPERRSPAAFRASPTWLEPDHRERPEVAGTRCARATKARHSPSSRALRTGSPFPPPAPASLTPGPSPHTPWRCRRRARAAEPVRDNGRVSTPSPPRTRPRARRCATPCSRPPSPPTASSTCSAPPPTRRWPAARPCPRCAPPAGTPRWRPSSGSSCCSSPCRRARAAPPAGRRDVLAAGWLAAAGGGRGARAPSTSARTAGPTARTGSSSPTSAALSAAPAARSAPAWTRPTCPRRGRRVHDARRPHRPQARRPRARPRHRLRHPGAARRPARHAGHGDRPQPARPGLRRLTLALSGAPSRGPARGLPVRAGRGDETYDLIVSNPPFVISPGAAGSTYRDGGLPGDDLCRRSSSRPPPS